MKREMSSEKIKNSNTIVVIGNSTAGLSAIDTIRQYDKRSRIVMISKEPHRPYSRCLLSYYLAGEIGKDRIWIRQKDYYKRNGIEPITGVEVESIDPSKNKIGLSGGKKVSYDRLLIASGAAAKFAKITGVDKKGVFVLRTLDDAQDIIAMLPGVKRVAVLGGGLIGMKAAYALSRRRLKVHVIVKSSHIFSQMLDRESSDIMREHLVKNGIEISTGLEAVRIDGDERVKGIELDDGNRLDCQLVIIGKGVSPNIGFAKGAIAANTGILTDERMAADKPGIYAAGDVSETFDLFERKRAINAIWPAAVRQGRIAALNMAVETAHYEGSYGMNSVDFFDLPVISFGLISPPDSTFEELIQADFNRSIYRKVIVKDDRIFGGIFINDIARHGILLHLGLQRVDISDIKSILVDEYFDYGRVIPLIKRQTENFIRPEYKDTVFTYNPQPSISLLGRW